MATITRSTSARKKRIRRLAGNKRLDIQGLRAVAVILVILDHLFGWPRGGFIGVDAFFVISGFLITGILVREGEKSGSLSISNFYRRRIRRIFPVAFLVLGVVVTTSYLLMLTSRFQSVASDAWWSLMFLVNWHLAAAGTDYFQSALPPSPLQHYWSLAVEEQFYVVWPVLIVSIIWTRKRWGLSFSLPMIVLSVAVAVTAGTFAFAMYQSQVAPTTAYFSTLTRAWELGVGAILATLSTRLAHMRLAIRQALGFGGLAGIVISAFAIGPESTFPAPLGALPVIATAMVLASGIGTGGDIVATHALRLKPVVYIGTISFSLYLWHWPIVVLLQTVMDTGIAYYALAVLLTASLSVASYHLVENSVLKSSWLRSVDRKHGRRRITMAPNAHTMNVALGALTIAAVLLGVIALNPRIPTSAPTPTTAVAKAADQGESDPLEVAIKSALSAEDFPSLTPPLDNIKSGMPEEMTTSANCLNPSTITNPSYCAYGPSDATRKAVVVGDSTAVSWLPGIREALEPVGYRIRGIGFGDCPFIDAEIVIEKDPEATRVCNESRSDIIDLINNSRPNLVVLSDFEGGPGRLKAAPNSGEAWANARASIIRKLAPSGARVFVISPNPRGQAATECASRFASPSECASDVSDAWLNKQWADESASQRSGATFVSVEPWFCYSGTCPIFVENIVVRWDSTHVTSQYARFIAPRLREAFDGQ